MAIGILSVGAHVPPLVVTNDTISTWASTTPEWIENRTGFIQRRYATDGTPTSALALAAVADLVQQHPDALRNVGAILLGTSTADKPQPSTGAIVQGQLDLDGVPACDVNAVCASWLYALGLGAGFARLLPAGANVLVIGADKYSTIMDRTDRRTVSIFGDGAGVVLLGDVPDGYGLLSVKLVAHGQHRDLVQVRAGGTRRPLDPTRLAAGEHLFRMQGHEVRRYALETLPKLIVATLDEAGLALGDVDRLVLHQANQKLLRELATALGADLNRLVLTPYYGNTGAASIPIALREAQRARPFARDEVVLLAGLGGGMTAGAVVTRFH